MEFFEIEDYKVSMRIFRSKSPGKEKATTSFERVLELRSKEMEHKIRLKVLLAFFSGFSGAWNEPVVGHLTGKVDDLMAGWMDLSEFQYYYDVLRSEKPVYFKYQFKEGTSGYITELGIRTSKEPLGEGLADKSVPLLVDLVDFGS
jgi:hypothetical protein